MTTAVEPVKEAARAERARRIGEIHSRGATNGSGHAVHALRLATARHVTAPVDDGGTYVDLPQLLQPSGSVALLDPDRRRDDSPGPHENGSPRHALVDSPAPSAYPAAGSESRF
ncbi:MAG: hypothetical protein ACODAE_05095 [Gemmatimonadota bacterium]